jgi:imidazolonepropionase-like amidohydrolase
MTNLVIRNAELLDGTGRDPRAGVDVAVTGTAISDIGRGVGTSPDQVIDGTGLTLMPGLTDAHVHMGLVDPAGGIGDLPWIDYVFTVRRVIENTLQEGFTTVRDAGGLDPHWARLVEQGVVQGPRILPSGSVLSQTGGHGDLRPAHHIVHPRGSIPGLSATPEIVDGVDQVRRAAREQLRKGATQIKVFSSGGVLSPTDPFDSLQFSYQELRAAVEAAADWHTYVLAHCHTSDAIRRALSAGIRSIEHASILDEDAAQQIVASDAFAVVTLAVKYDLLADPDRAGLTPSQLTKLRAVESQVHRSIEIMGETGVKVGSGSDIVGPLQDRRGRELSNKAKFMSPSDAIATATTGNAALFYMEDQIGTVEVGKDADLILVEGRPLDEIEVLADPDKIAAVIKGGRVYKDTQGRVS